LATATASVEIQPASQEQLRRFFVQHDAIIDVINIAANAAIAATKL
jgi:hypothetical protein